MSNKPFPEAVEISLKRAYISGIGFAVIAALFGVASGFFDLRGGRVTFIILSVASLCLAVGYLIWAIRLRRRRLE